MINVYVNTTNPSIYMVGVSIIYAAHNSYNLKVYYSFGSILIWFSYLGLNQWCMYVSIWVKLV